MKKVIVSGVICVALNLSTSISAHSPSYESLEQFCLATKADTAENCACGQSKANELLSAEEQRLVLGLMTRDPKAMSQLMQMADQGNALMEKVAIITSGCD